MTRKTVVIADDHKLVADGIKSLLENDYDVLAVVGDGKKLYENARKYQPDIIVSDISMPILNGIDAIKKIRKSNIDSKVILITMHPEVKYALRAIEAGADGYILKHSATEELLNAISTVLLGRRYVTDIIAKEVKRAQASSAGTSAEDSASKLTTRQREVLQLIAEGHTTKHIASIMNISARTVEFHKYKIIELLNLKNSTELITFAIENGFGNNT
jgi:DNA-binding NarL/FixJ family response regulator